MYPLCLRCFRMVLPPGSAEAVKASCQCEEPQTMTGMITTAWRGWTYTGSATILVEPKRERVPVPAVFQEAFEEEELEL